MPIAILISTVLFGACGMLHYAVMATMHGHLATRRWPRGAKLVICLYTAGLAHALEAGLYVIGFLLGQRLGIGGFRKDETMSVMDTFYFSMVNFTSLGLGSVYPSGHLRLVAVVESLNGFLLITCSASFIYLLMSERRGDG